MRVSEGEREEADWDLIRCLCRRSRAEKMNARRDWRNRGRRWRPIKTWPPLNFSLFLERSDSTQFWLALLVKLCALLNGVALSYWFPFSLDGG